MKQVDKSLIESLGTESLGLESFGEVVDSGWKALPKILGEFQRTNVYTDGPGPSIHGCCQCGC